MRQDKGFDMAVSIHRQGVTGVKAQVGLLRPLLIGSALAISACQTLPSSVPSQTGAAGTATTPAGSQVPAYQVPAYQVPMPQIPTSQAPAPARSNDYDTDTRYPDRPYNAPVETATPPLSYPPYPEAPRAQSTPSTNRASPTNSPLTQPRVVIQQPQAIFTEPTMLPAPTRDNNLIPQPPTSPSHRDLLERARQNSQQQNTSATNGRSELPAYRSLMQTGTSQLQSGNLNAAESSFTRAQRLSPRSSAVYSSLSQVALRKNQPRKAEAMARRGLAVAQDDGSRRALWQLILQSGQQQNNARVIREAQQALR